MQFSRISEQRIYDELKSLNTDFHNKSLDIKGLYEFLKKVDVDYKKSIFVECFPDDSAIVGWIIYNNVCYEFEYETDDVNEHEFKQAFLSTEPENKMKSRKHYARLLYDEEFTVQIGNYNKSLESVIANAHKIDSRDPLKFIYFVNIRNSAQLNRQATYIKGKKVFSKCGMMRSVAIVHRKYICGGSGFHISEFVTHKNFHTINLNHEILALVH